MKTKKIITAGLVITTMSALLTSCIKKYDNPASGTLGEQINMVDFRQTYRGAELTITPDKIGGATKIQGVVISDKSGANIDANSMVIQQTYATPNTAYDITAGIVVKFNAANTFNLGDSVEISVTGSLLNRVNGSLTLSGVTADKVKVLATGRVPLNRNITLGMLGAQADMFESTLVSVHADASEYSATATLAGNKKLNDNTGTDAYLMTRTDAGFASTALPINAQFNGIAGFWNANGKDTAGAIKVIMPRNAGDIQFKSGALYAGFPESFEAPDISVKSSYNSGTNNVQLATGTWNLLQGILANTVLSDKFNQPGKQSIRMQQNLTTSGYTQMNFDLPNGASKVTVFYGKYATDAKSSFRLEYSTNGGTTWTVLGANVTDMPDKANKQMTWTLNITTPIRFRINKLGTGTSNNGRLCLDDFAVYQKL
ncbi:MAG: hypothetical protein GXC72_04070 [Chitinophagaceae bacterium]|jgi:hypothetical protein|nr:hypothetical protein [Chitinophagaceae bacterium]